MRTHVFLAAIALAVAALVGCGRNEPATAAAPSAAPTAAAPAPAASAPAPVAAVADNPVGKATFNKVCALCHSAGVGGAPKPGDKADWGPRIAQGDEVLFKHALEGFTGAKGTMPARGGSPALTDDEVKAAVTHMTSLSR